MGYRSDVVLVVSKKAMPHFMVTVATVPEGLELCFQDHDTMKKDYDGEEGSILFHWSWVKWYERYAGVAAVNSFLIKMGDLECEDFEEWGYEYRFVRKGEEADDSELLGSGFEDVCISREIQF
jgi:hypothetical protein